MRDVYARLGADVVVEPLFLHNSELDAAAILSMMAVGSTESAPLYMQIILVRHVLYIYITFKPRSLSPSSENWVKSLLIQIL